MVVLPAKAHPNIVQFIESTTYLKSVGIERFDDPQRGETMGDQVIMIIIIVRNSPTFNP